MESIDGLGQGISRDGKATCFIAKTLPGETGTAEVTREAKGVIFAKLKALDSPAPNRIQPACEHYSDCPACHFLHTDYESELSYKLDALLHLLNDLPVDKNAISVHPAPQRLAYRNRIQLHYRHKYIGMLDGDGDRVLEIPHCKVIDSALQSSLDALYADKSWADKNPGRGHCELYLKDGQVSTAWNEPYAHGGFTQVNAVMNAALRELVESYARQAPAETIIELFSGQGNLTEALVASPQCQRVLVDYFADEDQRGLSGFYNLDLYDADALGSLRRRESVGQFDLMVVDPPRKGFPLLSEWVQHYQPKQLIYVSCNATTLARDIRSLQGKFVITDTCLMDLFPGTHHYETVVRIAFKNHKVTKQRGTKNRR